MSNPTLPNHDPQSRVRQLLQQITVTNIETGQRLDGAAKRGRVFAAARGYVSTLVHVEWNGTATEMKAALDALRTEQDPPPPRRLTRDRAERVIDRCLTPMRASRASDRVHKLALRVQAQGEARYADDLLSLSTALNERRHAIIQCRLGSDDFRPHAEEVRYLIERLPRTVQA